MAKSKAYAKSTPFGTFWKSASKSDQRARDAKAANKKSWASKGFNAHAPKGKYGATLTPRGSKRDANGDLTVIKRFPETKIRQNSFFHR